MKKQLRTLIIAAVFIALTYVFTAFINIQIPPGNPAGLTHLGNIPVFIAAMLFGKKTGAAVGGIGMALFDLFSPYAVWAPFTLIINALMGLVIALIVENRHKFKWYLLAVVAAIIIKVGGYYIAEGILYGNWLAPMAAIPANILQVVVAAVAVLPIINRLRLVVQKAQNSNV